MKQENVNHPSHYNSHPNGIECIDIIRHYTCDIANAIKYLWRAGLKPEMGKDDANKEIEDLKKALWYIEDYCQKGDVNTNNLVEKSQMYIFVNEVTGYRIDKIYHGYVTPVSTALGHLLCVGLIRNGEVRHVFCWRPLLDEAAEDIRQRILDIENMSAQ